MRNGFAMKCSPAIGKRFELAIESLVHLVRSTSGCKCGIRELTYMREAHKRTSFLELLEGAYQFVPRGISVVKSSQNRLHFLYENGKNLGVDFGHVFGCHAL